MAKASDILTLVATMKEKGQPFALATVVRTVAATAAKAGARAVILPDGSIVEGWVGGGCARATVIKAARQALTDGRVRLVSIQPADLLDQRGVAPGDELEGIAFATNACPSQGTMDIFVEPVLPRPEIVICGSSPVAVAVADLGRQLGFRVTACAPAGEQMAFADVERRIEGYNLPVEHDGKRFIVVSTQSRGDEAALEAALSVEADYVAFVGSRRKAETLKRRLLERGVDKRRIDALKAPAGLNIGAITPEEISLSILSEIVALHRKSQRADLA